ncbi:DUF3265 domain-containing protein [Vibrio parahaemolyticus]|nr:DUF3265 domain-containing protein [Vibrio parahaemolyticus]
MFDGCPRLLTNSLRVIRNAWHFWLKFDLIVTVYCGCMVQNERS